MRWGRAGIATVALALLSLAAAPNIAAEDAARSTSSTDPAPSTPQNLETMAPGEALSVLGTKVYDAAGADMGPIVDVLVDRTGAPRGAVIDVGGFLGVGSRKVAVDWQLIYFRPWDDKMPILLDLSRAEVQAAPEYKGAKTAKLVGPPPPLEGKSVPDDAK